MSNFTTDGERVVSRAELLEAGFTPKGITRAVRSGTLTRLRRDHYVRTASRAADIAVRIGGRLTCVSALAAAGVFTIDDARVHVHVGREMSRVRGPRHRRDRWRRDVHGAIARVHWGDLTEPATREAVGLEDAIRTLVTCRPPREVIAALDSVLHLGLMSESEMRTLFRALPAKYGVLLRLVDGRAESGTESFVRLMLRRLGIPFEVQVELGGVGRVDFVIAAKLIIECDSRAHHGDWSQRRRDIRRDQEAARRGFATIRLLAEDIIFHPEDVEALLADVARSDLLR
ncbi:UNVERIFIED_CONTAM: DUF559 domain-containing protein [Microbacterium sp. SLM126]